MTRHRGRWRRECVRPGIHPSTAKHFLSDPVLRAGWLPAETHQRLRATALRVPDQPEARFPRSNHCPRDRFCHRPIVRRTATPIRGADVFPPRRIGSRIFDGNPCHRLIVPIAGISAVFPVSKKIMVVFGVIVGGVHKCLEFGIGHRSTVDIKVGDMDPMTMGSPCNIFPGILHIDSGIVSAFNLNAAYLEVIIRARNQNHAGRVPRAGFVAGISTIF